MASAPSSSGDHPSITINVQEQGGEVLSFKVKYHAKLETLLKLFCEEMELDYHTVQFLYKGKRIISRSTPAGLNLKEGDCIEAMMHVHGGSSFLV